MIHENRGNRTIDQTSSKHGWYFMKHDLRLEMDVVIEYFKIDNRREFTKADINTCTIP